MRWLLGAFALVAASTAVAAAPEILAGQRYSWRLAVSEGAQCVEDWRFGVDGVLSVTSGEEVTTHTYALRPSDDPGMHVLERTRLSSNGRPDCMGNQDASVGQASSVYLVFLNGGGFFTCGSADTMSCYGVATPSIDQ